MPKQLNLVEFHNLTNKQDSTKDNYEQKSFRPRHQFVKILNLFTAKTLHLIPERCDQRCVHRLVRLLFERQWTSYCPAHSNNISKNRTLGNASTALTKSAERQPWNRCRLNASSGNVVFIESSAKTICHVSYHIVCHFSRSDQTFVIFPARHSVQYAVRSEL